MSTKSGSADTTKVSATFGMVLFSSSFDVSRTPFSHHFRRRTLYADESVLVSSGRPTWRDSRFLRNFERAPDTDKICRVETTQQLPFALLPVQVTSKKRTALCMLLGWCFFSHYTRDQGCEFSQISPQIILFFNPPAFPYPPAHPRLGLWVQGRLSSLL